MRYFQNVNGLSILENQGKWDNARLLLYKNWACKKTCGDSLLRLLTECWYVLSLWDCCICTERLSYQKFQNTLLEATAYGIKEFPHHQKFLCITGYMIHMLPHLFCTEQSRISYSDWEKIGLDMLQKAKNCYSYDTVVNILNLGLSSDQIAFQKAKESLAPKLDSIFPKETAIEIYFNDILSV